VTLRLSAIVALALLLGSASARADAEEDPGIVTLQVENDKVANTDRNYTSGLRAAWLSGETRDEHWVRDLAEYFPLISNTDRIRYGLSVGQSIFTPQDTESRELVENDRPYAGWLYGGLSMISYDKEKRNLQTLALDIGVVGPAALGRQTQNRFHEIIDVDKAKGWDNQLENEPGVLLTYQRSRRVVYLQSDGYDRLGFDIMPHVGGALGNVMTYGAAGASVRLGFDLLDDFGPPRIRPSLPGADFFNTKRGWSGYLFAGSEARLVARNIFLDGNTFRDSHSIDKRTFVYDIQAGIAISHGPLRFSYTHVYRSSEIQNQERGDRFGSVALSFVQPF
jgi:hypothetical protein